MEAAREEARQKALEGNQGCRAKRLAALAEWLKLTFPEHRQSSNINVSSSATAQQATVICTEEQRQRLIALREKLLNAPPLDATKQ
jgi:hypothetical protein